MDPPPTPKTDPDALTALDATEPGIVFLTNDEAPVVRGAIDEHGVAMWVGRIYRSNRCTHVSCKNAEESDGVYQNYDFAIERLLTDFSGPDITFGCGGVQTVAFDLGGRTGEDTDSCNVALRQSTGKIVLAGQAYASTGSQSLTTSDVALTRLNSDSTRVDHPLFLPLRVFERSASSRCQRRGLQGLAGIQ